jgi:peptidoglycan/LPS O-acetylase OafA/YrhL
VTSTPTETDTELHTKELGKPASRVEPLDGLRTIAIAVVVLYHAHVPSFTGGFIGVCAFFVLSGYLITSILLRERTKTGHIDLRRFWLRRVLRLYPVLLAVVIAAVCLWFMVSNYEGANVEAWTAAILALTYTSNIARWLFHKSIGVLSQTWSLGMEEQFYLVWPPILVLLLRGRARRFVVVAVLGALVVASSVATWMLYAPRSGTSTPDIYFSPISSVAPLLTGCLLAIAFRSEAVRNVFRSRLGTIATWAGVVALVSIEVSVVKGWQENVATFGLTLPLTGIASALLIAGVVSRSSVVARFLSFSPIAWFGRNASYSLYIWHVLVFALVLPLVPGLVGKFAAIAASCVVAVASHFAIEKPFAKLKSRLEPRPFTAKSEREPEPSRELTGTRAAQLATTSR